MGLRHNQPLFRGHFGRRWNTVLRASLSPTTAAIYQRNWDVFRQFLRAQPNIPVTFPVQEEHIAQFLVRLHDTNKSLSTIRTYVSAISFTHKLVGTQDPTNAFIVAKTLQGIKNQQAQRISQTKLPITKELLRSLVHSLRFSVPDNYSRAMWKAIFLFTYHACLRAGEAVFSATSQHTLRLDQLTLTHNTATIRFETFKHNNKSSDTVILQASADTVTCPLLALHQYLQLRGRKPGRLFIHANATQVTRAQLTQALHSALTMAGHTAHRYNTHSFRIGKATQLASENHSDSTIRTAGRWRTTAFKRYIRPQGFVMPQ